MYLSELEYWSESWRRMNVHQEEYSCPVGSTKTPSEVHQRPVGVQMYSCTAVGGVQENVAIEDGGSWFSAKKGPRHIQWRIV
jgi:hypothetical protein